jgi:hypothetical protein
VETEKDRPAFVGFVERELQRIAVALNQEAETTERYGRLYAAQQALSWALEPRAFRSPYDALTGTPANLEGCPSYPSPLSS